LERDDIIVDDVIAFRGQRLAPSGRRIMLCRPYDGALLPILRACIDSAMLDIGV